MGGKKVNGRKRHFAVHTLRLTLGYLCDGQRMYRITKGDVGHHLDFSGLIGTKSAFWIIFIC